MIATWLLLLCLLCVPAKGVGEAREDGGEEMQVSMERRSSGEVQVVGSRYKRASKKAKKRMRCPPGLKMTSKGCAKAWSLTWPDRDIRQINRAIFYMKSKLERTLEMELETPCHSVIMRSPLSSGMYCEICPKTDPSRIHCPVSAQLSWEQRTDYMPPWNISASEDYSAFQCTDKLKYCEDQFDYSYWPMYDDGSICDCGSPFIVEGNYTKEIQTIKFRSPRQNEAKEKFQSLGSHSGASTLQMGGWTALKDVSQKTQFAAGGIYDDAVLPPSIPAARCHSRPDISSMLENHFTTWSNGQPIKEELIEDKTYCNEENTYLSWFNGEPIAEEVKKGGDDGWCAAKCRSNPSCDAWTLNTSNGWCALKRQDQVKRQRKPGFVSGFNIC